MEATQQTDQALEQIAPGLYASAPEELPFGTDLEIRAFLLKREDGNLLVDRSRALAGQIEGVRRLGGAARQYLNHRHEAASVCDLLAAELDAPLHVHEADANGTAESCAVSATFSERHRVGSDFEAIPIPGHTAGATAYLWEGPDGRFLFTGDSIMVNGEGGWFAVLFEKGDRSAYISSLELVRELEFDVLVPAITRAGRPLVHLADQSERERQIDAIIARLRAGERN